MIDEYAMTLLTKPKEAALTLASQRVNRNHLRSIQSYGVDSRLIELMRTRPIVGSVKAQNGGVEGAGSNNMMPWNSVSRRIVDGAETTGIPVRHNRTGIPDLMIHGSTADGPPRVESDTTPGEVIPAVTDGLCTRRSNGAVYK